jgi:outer membrane protein
MRLLLLSLVCWSQMALAANVGVIDVEAVLASSAQAQKARSQWQADLAPVEADIQRLIDSLQSLPEDDQNARRDVTIQINQLQQQAQAQLTQWENEFLAKQLPILERLVIEIADENNLDLVVRADAVVWGRANVNYSDDLLARYNQP